MLRGGNTIIHRIERNKNMVTKNILMKFGFAKDEDNLQLKKIFQNNSKLKELHIDIYPNNPMISSGNFALLLRTLDDNVVILNDGNRLILKRCDKYETHIMNILFSSISECYVKIAENYYELILNVQNIYYKITILN